MRALLLGVGPGSKPRARYLPPSPGHAGSGGYCWVSAWVPASLRLERGTEQHATLEKVPVLGLGLSRFSGRSVGIPSRFMESVATPQLFGQGKLGVGGISLRPCGTLRFLLSSLQRL